MKPDGPRDVTLSYKGRVVRDFAELLNAYPDREFRSPARSTVPLLACWRSWHTALEGLSNRLGEPLPGPIELAFEYQVPWRHGDRRPSHTDLMVLSPTHVVAIEAKYTELSYDSVTGWLAKARSGSRESVLAGWLELINGALRTSLTADQIGECTYQLVHRTASACKPPARSRAVVYQCFDVQPSARDVYVDQLRQLDRLIGNQPALRFYFLDCRLEKSASYEVLRERWQSGERDLANEVREGLRNGTLLECASCSVVRV